MSRCRSPRSFARRSIRAATSGWPSSSPRDSRCHGRREKGRGIAAPPRRGQGQGQGGASRRFDRRGLATSRRHSPARAGPRRHAARSRRRRDVPDRRGHPADGRAVPPLRRSRSARRAGQDARRARGRADDLGREGLQLLLASREHRRGPAPQARLPARPARRQAAARGIAHPRARAAQSGRREDGPLAGDARSSRHQPRPHGAPDRGPAQEHPRPPGRHRAPALGARSPEVHGGGGRRERPSVAPRGEHHVADAHAAAREADGLRRDRERALVLSIHVLVGASAPLRRLRGPARSRVRDLRTVAAAADAAHRELDRRRSRRPSVREPRRPRLWGQAAVPGRLRVLPRTGARARSRAAPIASPGPGVAAAQGAGGGVARSLRAAPRRALSARAGPHVFASRSDRAAPERPRSAAPTPPSARSPMRAPRNS